MPKQESKINGYEIKLTQCDKKCQGLAWLQCISTSLFLSTPFFISSLSLSFLKSALRLREFESCSLVSGWTQVPNSISPGDLETANGKEEQSHLSVGYIFTADPGH